MKKIILALISTLAIISCDNLYLEEINAIHKEMDVLRELIDRANSNVDAMQVVVSALQANDYVTGVTPIVENGVTTGYTIAFSKSGLAHIYHGKDGKDGYTPQISIKKDTDGLYYWTLDGQWMKDNAGQKVRAVGIDGEDGKDGENGKDGEDGQNGKDGVTPKLKIEDGYWYVSLDNGATWLEKTLGQATGDKGDKGDAFLSGVDNTNSDYVIITLANGETIKLPTWSAFEALKEQCDKMNQNISALQTAVTALENNDYVKSVTPIYDGIKEIGYIINFTKSEKVTIYHGNDGKDGENGDDGKDGYTPQISIKKDTDGLYYWTLDGEWMKDDLGNNICAVGLNGKDGENGQPGENGENGQPGKDGITPQLKIENGYWYVSFDNGNTWSEKTLGQATGDKGSDGDSFFKDIVVGEHEIKFITSEGDEFVVPRNRKVKLTLDVKDGETGILPGSEIVVNYTLENATDQTFVTASSNGVYTVRVAPQNKSQGQIYINAPYKYSDGYINVMVTDGESFSLIKVINFYEEKMTFSNGLEYSVSSKGGTITIPFRTNFDYSFRIDYGSNWMTILSADTRAVMKDGDLIIEVAANNEEYARTGKISVIPYNSTGSIYEEIIINQSSATFSVEQSKYAVHVDGETLNTLVSSSRGLSIKVPAEASDWLSAEMTDLENDNYRITTVVQKNESLDVRSATVELYSGDGSKYLGQIEYVQSSSVEDELSNMVLVVRANMTNDFTITFNILKYISTNTDCYIDWGDGQAERCQASSDITVAHKYDVSVPTDFTVKISGIMSCFDGQSPCIKEVKQWGRTGLIMVDFTNNTSLINICADKYGSFNDLMHIRFEGCSNLQSIPAGLFKYAKSITDLSSVFSKCRSLTSIPESLFEGCIGLENLSGAFYGCTGLTTLPENLFKGCFNVNSFDSTFSNCSNITTLPENLFIDCTNIDSFQMTFSSCYNLTSIPETLFKNCKKVYSFYETFAVCKKLTTLPENLFNWCPDVTDFNWTFWACENLTYVPTGLFDNNRKVVNFDYIFSGCNLSGESPYTIVDGVKYHLYDRYKNPDYFITPRTFNCSFDGCYQLSDREEISANGWCN